VHFPVNTILVEVQLMDRQNRDRVGGINRRGFLEGIAAGTVASLSLSSPAHAQESPGQLLGQDSGLPKGTPVRVLPVLGYRLESPKKLASWKSYGDLHEQGAVEAEARRIEADLKELARQAEFPIEISPTQLVMDENQAKAVAATDTDLLIMFASGGDYSLYTTLATSKAAKVMFVRYRTRPYYLFYVIAHWHFLRRLGDSFVEPNMDIDDIVIDDYNELLWRMRSVYGLKNAKGTKMLAIGGLAAYSDPGQELGPAHAKEVWGYEIEVVPREDFAARLKQARSDDSVMADVERETQAFLDRPNLTLETQRKFVFNSFLTLRVCCELLREKKAFNFGFDYCMRPEVIEMLDTPPCLVLALANDIGYTAYCHTDLTHTCPGVFLRWTASKPTLVCNTHFPHDGIITVAHCAAPMKMNGVSNEPVTVMTHYESDYGAASRVHYPLGQTVTVVIPSVSFTGWQGFRGKIIENQTLEACRSQMNIAMDGDCRALVREMKGFHAQVVYGDYLREVGYALKQLKKLEWRNFSEA